MKRPWTRIEKSLLATPLLFVVFVGGLWVWRKALPTSLELPDASDISALEFSPDGKQLLVFFENSKTFLVRTTGQVYDLESRTKRCDLATPPRIASPNPRFPAGEPYFSWPSWSPDGARIVAGYNDNSKGMTTVQSRFRSAKKSPAFYLNQIGKIALWDAQSGRLRGNYLYAPANEDSYSKSIRFSSDGTTLIGDGIPPSVFDSVTGQRLSVLNGGLPRAYQTKTSKQSGLLAVIGEKFSRFQVFDPKTKRVVWEPHIGSVSSFQWCGDVLGAIDSGRDEPGHRQGEDRLLLWDAKARAVLPSPPLIQSGHVTVLSFNPDKATLVTLNFKSIPSKPTRKIDGELIAWNYRSHRVMWRYPIKTPLTWVQWSPDGNWLSMIAAPLNASERLLALDRNGHLRMERKIASYITRWSPDSSRIALASRAPDATMRIELVRVDG